jgi:hypothetical protein
MTRHAPDPPDEDDPEDALWFMPGPVHSDDLLAPPLPPRAETVERHIADWTRAEAAQAASLARVAARLGALDERLLRGPPGWRHRLALIEAADLSWITGDRVPADRLALWVAMRLGSVQDDPAGLQRAAWAFRRLAGGPGPQGGLQAFLGRRDSDGDPAVREPAPYRPDGTMRGLDTPADTPGQGATEDRLPGRLSDWLDALETADHLHPITRACLGFHLWPLTPASPQADRVEGAVTAARLAMAEGQGGAVFAPVAGGGGAGLRNGGEPPARLARWLDGLDQGLRAAMRGLDRIADWQARATQATQDLSGRTPDLLIAALVEWPLITAPMAEALTGASRAAVQRNLTGFEMRGLIDEVTGQGRFRVWRAALSPT